MPVPRFHLSTLLLFCVFCGAALGLFFSPESWQLDSTLPLDVAKDPQSNLGPYLAFSNDNRFLAVLHTDRVHLYDLNGRALVWQVHVTRSIRAWLQDIHFTNEPNFITVNEVQMMMGGQRSFLQTPHLLSIADGTETKPRPKYKLIPTIFDSYSGSHASIAPNKEEIARYRLDDRELEIFINGPAPDKSTLLCRMFTPSPIYAAEYSPDNRLLAVRESDRLEIYRRVRPYGRSGIFAQPVFWVVVLSLAALTIRYLRWRKQTVKP